MRNIFSIVPFVLLNLRAPDAGSGNGGAGGGEPTPAPTEPPQPTGDTVESKLQSAIGHIKDLFTRAGQLVSQLATATSERTKLEAQFNAAANDLKTEKDAHTATKGLLSTANTQVTGLTTERDNANQNVERLEKLCNLRGIDHSKAVAAAPEGGATGQGGQGKWDKYNQLKDEESKGKQKAGTAMAYWKENKAELEKFAASQR